MTTMWWLVIALGVAAGCKGKRNEAVPASGSGSATSGSATSGSAVAALDASVNVADAVVAASAEPGCEGWSASKVEHMGMGQVSLSVECKGGNVTTTSTTEGARDEEVETSTNAATREAWVALWKQLDAAGWRELPDDCPAVVPPPDSFGITELELVITDGNTKKSIRCEGANVTATHQAIIDALDAVAE